MWKEALLKNTTTTGPGHNGTQALQVPALQVHDGMSTTPDGNLDDHRTPPNSSLTSTPNSAAPSVMATPPHGMEVPSVEYFAKFRPTKESQGNDGVSVTSTEFTKASATRSESWADDDDDFLDSVMCLKNNSGQPQQILTAGRSQQSGGRQQGGWKAVSKGGRSGGDKGGGGGGGGRSNQGNTKRGDGHSTTPGPQPNGGRFDALGGFRR